MEQRSFCDKIAVQSAQDIDSQGGVPNSFDCCSQLDFDNSESHWYSFLLYILFAVPMYTLSSGRILFGAFELDLSTGELRSIEAPDPINKVILREQVFQVLRMLLEREGKIVTREEI